jgi:hypothetical protein
MKNKYQVCKTKINQHQREINRVNRLAAPKLSILVLGSLLAVFSLAYLFQVTGGTVVGFEKQSFEKQINGLQKDAEKLKTEVAALDAIDTVSGQGMVQVEKIEYLTVENGASMALAR